MNKYVSGTNVYEQVHKETLESGDGPYEVLVALSPVNPVYIQITANGETVEVSITTDIFTDIEDVNINWTSVHDATTDYLGTAAAGISGVKVATTPVTKDVVVSIVQKGI